MFRLIDLTGPKVVDELMVRHGASSTRRDGNGMRNETRRVRECNRFTRLKSQAQAACMWLNVANPIPVLTAPIAG